MGIPRITPKRLAIGGSAILLLLAAAVYFAVIWYYANVLESDGLAIDRSQEYEVEVAAIGSGLITLVPPDNNHSAIPPLIGLEWPEGYARADGIVGEIGDGVVRGYTPIEGDLGIGDLVRYDRGAYVDDPFAALGIAYQPVQFDAPLGPLDAWYVNHSGDTWVIYVHGKGNDRGEGLRLLPLAIDAGMPSLLISYRSHETSPDDPSGRYQYGLTEWQDVEAAVQYALDNGAGSVILAGWSMGGGVIASLMLQSDLAASVDALILDSPMLDFGATVDWGAKQRSLPQFLTTGAKWLADLRFGVDWSAMDYLASVDHIDVPTLLIHGDADKTVPVRTSRDFAAARPDIVTYLEIPGAPHTGSWNTDRAAYEAAVREFLAR